MKFSDYFGESATWETGRTNTVSTPSIGELTIKKSIIHDSETLDFEKSMDVLYNEDKAHDNVEDIMYEGAKNIFVPKNATSSNSFIGIKTNVLFLYDKTISVTASKRQFSGNGDGTAPPILLQNFNITLRGGDGAGSTAGDAGDNWYAGGARYSTARAYGGGSIVLVADKIVGNGTIEAKGGLGYNCAGGGGNILIFVKEWSGEVALNVSGGSSAGQGSYAIYKTNEDGTETLMVHSKNGVSADLNGETPVHGADATIAW